LRRTGRRLYTGTGLEHTWLVGLRYGPSAERQKARPSAETDRGQRHWSGRKYTYARDCYRASRVDGVFGSGNATSRPIAVN